MDVAGPVIPSDVPSSGSTRCRPLPYVHPQEDVSHVENSGDIYWKLADMKRAREADPRAGATRKVNAKDAVLTAFETTEAVACAEPAPPVKGSHGQDSDVDSGIVGCSKPGQRVGSTSSTDTDSSQETRQKTDFCIPVTRRELPEKLSGAHFRTVNRNSCLLPPGSPVKGDHSVLKECNRRPPTPLTVFGESNQCVRFDDQLQLSEQNIRRSCRKLFATLYAQRFSYPSVTSPAQEATIVQCEGRSVPHRNRSQTTPDSDLRKYHPIVNDRLRTTRNRTFVDCSKNKENSGSARKAVSWNLNHPEHRLQGQMTIADTKVPKQVSVSPCLTPKELRLSGNIPIHLNDCRTSLKSSTDSGIAGCRSRCTCQCAIRNSSGFSSQSSTSSNSSTSTNHSCCCSQTPPKSENPNSPSLFKSSSCSTLPSMLVQAGLRVPAQATAVSCSLTPARQRCPVSLQKTSSCSSLMTRTRNVSFTNVPIYSDNVVHPYNDSMMHVYAQVASVVPDSMSQTASISREPQYERIQAGREHIYDTVRSPPVAVPSNVLQHCRNASSYRSTKFNGAPAYVSGKNESLTNYRSRDNYCNETKDIYSRQIPAATPTEASVSTQGRLVPFRRENQRYSTHYSLTASPRPVPVEVQSSERQNVYLKSALKQPKTASHQNVLQASEAQNGNAVRIPSEAEYAVVDKSKKNRFTSLPALNRYSSNSCIPDDDKDQPPVPPKKDLHKSEFNLYRSRSSSPKKGFRERVTGFTRSAKNAFQRAFSTERIYRPEREERLEASGQGFHRSKSFIKGLRASLSKKRKKNKPPMAEVVPQASCNPIWDEQPSGPNSPIHVRGQLLQLNLDGSQVVELSKPPSKPYGFFVARGRVRNSRGVFVSRMRDQETQKQLAGLLDIGDEILEIEGHNVKDSDIMEVNNLMANKNTLLLTVLPYICRKDI